MKKLNYATIVIAAAALIGGAAMGTSTILGVSLAFIAIAIALHNLYKIELKEIEKELSELVGQHFFTCDNGIDLHFDSANYSKEIS